MTSTALRPGQASAHPGAFRHEALLYAGEADFVAATGAFLRDGVAAGEASLVVVSDRKIGLLREELGADADAVMFADMADVGANPARIIPAWRDFVSAQVDAGRRFRGIGEPIWAERAADELVECQRHEALLNVAFDGSPDWWLVCPYDTNALPDEVLAEARRSHPLVMRDGVSTASFDYRGVDGCAAPFDSELPEPAVVPAEIAFSVGSDLGVVRTFVAERATHAGLGRGRTADLVLAVDEVAANTIRHGGGLGALRIWRDRETLLCEIQDRGRIDRPLVGRVRPSPEREGGWGLWIVNQLCDLVQVRTFPDRSVVRLHMRLA